MYISSLRKTGSLSIGKKLFIIFMCVFVLLASVMLRFLKIAAPFVENKARFIAIDIINSGVSKYLKRNPDVFDRIINISTAPGGELSSALVNTKNLNLIKSELTEIINNALAKDKSYTVKIPLANFLGITFLSGIGAPIKIKMNPVSRVLIDFENDFYSAGINQTHLVLNLRVKVTVMVIIPGIRRSVTVETDVPVGEAVFMGEVPEFYAIPGSIQPSP